MGEIPPNAVVHVSDGDVGIWAFARGQVCIAANASKRCEKKPSSNASSCEEATLTATTVLTGHGPAADGWTMTTWGDKNDGCAIITARVYSDRNTEC